MTIADGKIRLEGIDAPESDQVCLDRRGAKWLCGITVRDQLAEYIGHRSAASGRSLPITIAIGGSRRKTDRGNPVGWQQRQRIVYGVRVPRTRRPQWQSHDQRIGRLLGVLC